MLSILLLKLPHVRSTVIRILCFLLSIQSCSPESIKSKGVANEDFVPRVVNGWPAKLGDVPYQIAFKRILSRPSLYYTFCGGVLIGANKLMSAAHCFEDKGSACMKKKGKASKKLLSGTKAVAGNLFNKVRYVSQNHDGQWRNVRSMYFPRTYRFPKDDISIGFTSQPFLINAYVAPITYATRYADYKGKCLVSGYGRIGKNTNSEVLLLAHLVLIQSAQCSKMHRKNMKKFVCTSDYTTDVGKGDSGGPLVCTNTGESKEGPKGILVGIVSGNRIPVGSFFTRVSSYTSFLNKNNGVWSKPYKVLVWLCLLNSIMLSLLCFI